MLYRDLPEQEAGLAVERLSSAGVKARLGDDGRSVWVPSGSLEQARLVLARDGLPVAGGAGFELFDETGFGMTDFLEQVNYRRALEGELSRTITALDEVSRARVHLVLPRESVFATESEPAKASVSLRLHRPMAAGNVEAVGARVQVRVRRGGPVQTAWVGENDASRLSQGHYRLYFGFGKGNGRVRSIIVSWPDGGRTRLSGVRPNQVLKVARP